MRTVQPGMNVARQRRMITHQRDERAAAGDLDAAAYLAYLVGRFDAGAALGLPRTASEWLSIYDEEFENADAARQAFPGQ